MDIALDEVVTFDVLTSSPTTGAATDADSTPAFKVFEDTTDTDIGVGGNLTKRTGETGNYRGTITLSAANGFEVGKWYNVIALATVSAIAGKCRALHFRVAAAEAVVGKPPVDVSAISGDSTAADTLESYTDGTTKQPVDVVKWGGEDVAFDDGTAQAISNSPPSITLASGFDGECTGRSISVLFESFGTVGSAQITSYNNTTKVALVDRAWPRVDEPPSYTFGPYVPRPSDIATATDAAVTSSHGAGAYNTTSDVPGSLDAQGMTEAWVDAVTAIMADWTNGGRLDLLIDAIKAKTDDLLKVYISGSVTTGASATVVPASGAELSTTDDVYNEMFLVPTSGVFINIPTRISDYSGSKVFTIDGYGTALANGTTFILIGKSGSAD